HYASVLRQQDVLRSGELGKHCSDSGQCIAVVLRRGGSRRWHYRAIAVAFGFIGDLLRVLQTGPVGTAKLGEGCQLIKSGWISHAIGSELTERGGCMNDFPDGSVIRGLEVNDIRGHRKIGRASCRERV